MPSPSASKPDPKEMAEFLHSHLVDFAQNLQRSRNLVTFYKKISQDSPESKSVQRLISSGPQSFFFTRHLKRYCARSPPPSIPWQTQQR